MFLSDEEIQELTGYKQRTSQTKWLRQNGIKYLLGGDGKPRVLHSYVNHILGVTSKPIKRRAEPNEEALNSFMGLN